MTRAELIELTVACPSDDVAALVAEGLVFLGLGGAQEVADTVLAWTPLSDDVRLAGPAEAMLKLRRRLEDYVGLPLALDWRIIEAADWNGAWRRGLQPRRVGERIVVAPTWTEPELRPGDMLLSIDPEMAFGTGEHGTTRGMLRLLQQIDCNGARVLDVGTGSAILAIAAAALGAREVRAVEGDSDALINAADNVERHGVGATVRLEHAFVDQPWLADSGTWDIILANILSSVIRPLLPAFGAALRPGGALLVSGILQAEADDVLSAAATAGFHLRLEDREDEWWSAWLERLNRTP